MQLLVFHAHGLEVLAAVIKHVIPAPVALAVEEQGQLIDAVDNPVCGNLLLGAGDPGRGDEQVGHRDHVQRLLPGFYHAGPDGKPRCAHAAFIDLPLGAAQPGIAGVGPEAVHGSVVAHPHNQRILLYAGFFHRIEQLADIVIVLSQLRRLVVAGILPFTESVFTRG